MSATLDGADRLSRRIDRAAEWRARLARVSAAALVYLTVSGLVVWWAPFAILSQVAVLTHTVLGLALLVPVGLYAFRHWRLYRGHLFTAIKLLGYLALFLLIACAVSGLVLTAQSAFGVRIGYTWRAVHRWTTVGLVALGLPHLVLIVLRDRAVRASEAVAPAWAAMKVYASSAAVGGTLLLLAGAAPTYFYRAPRLQAAFPEGYELWPPRNPQYANNREFAPSLARTKGNAPLDTRLLSGSRGCGTMGCHEQIVREWLPSAHRFAAMDKAFQAIQLTMARQNGPVSTRYCGGCHDPISLFSGTKNIDGDEKNLTGLHGFQEGVSCLSCHSVRDTDIKGNAHYTMDRPPRYLGELEFDATGARGWRVVRDFLIRAYPGEHVAGLSKVMFKKPEYCAACHKQFIDEEVNKVGWVQLQNQYDNWKASKWARGDKAESVLECRECHMPLVKSTDPAAGDSRDYNRSPQDGRHRSHRFVAANALMPPLLGLEGSDEQARLTHLWLQGKLAVPEIEGKWAPADAPAVSLQITAPEKVRPRDDVKLACTITSNKVGHDFPTGPLDIIQAWIELVVRDESGRVVFETGTVDDKGFIKPGSFMFKSEPVDQYGNLIDRHNLWEMVGVRQRRSLFPGFSDQAEFSFVCPSQRPDRKALTLPQQAAFGFRAVAPGTLDVTAKLRYRKIDQFLLNFLGSVGFFAELKDKTLTAPITDMHEQHAVVKVVES
jgi:hypothetical protein